MMSLRQQLAEWSITSMQQHVTSSVEAKLGTFASKAIEAEKIVDAYTFKYDSQGVEVAGFIVAPKNISWKLPVIVFNRGGTGDFGLVTIGMLFTQLARLARQGYMVIGSQYPGNSVSEGKDERGGASDVASVLRLYDLVTYLDCADENRIGMYGFSRGGMMTYLCMKKVRWIKTALTVGGLANLDRSLHLRPELKKLYEISFGNTKEGITERSVVQWANELNKTTPLCILHGREDERVNVGDALELAEKLQQHDHPYSLHIFNKGDHSLTNVADERDSLIREWFGSYLKK